MIHVIEVTPMNFLKHCIPYALLWLYDANYGHMAMETYLVVSLLLVAVDVRSHMTGYRSGYRIAERI